jgi:DNA primase
VQLKKEGAAFGGLCPFHEEKTGSFKVFPDSKRFKCFGCGAAGDVFEFFRMLEGKSFPVILRTLAAGVGVDVPDRELTPAQKRAFGERAALQSATAAAVEHWTANLWGAPGAKAREYLASRGLREDTLRSFRIGYAIADWHDLHKAVRARGGAVSEFQRAGLLVDTGDYLKTYDRFRDRIIFPLTAPGGHVLGFGGRALTLSMSTSTGPKYVNGPETPLFKKSRVLFGIDKARDTIRRTRTAILVEGYVDVLALHQAGFPSTVGSCGTGLTEEHVQVLRRCGCEQVTMLFDGDAAGAAAPTDAGRVLLRAGLEGKVAQLPGRVDPDEFVRAKGRQALDAILTAAVPLTEFLLEYFTRRRCPDGVTHASAEQRLRAVRDLTPYVAASADEAFRTLLVKRIARKFEIDIGVLRAEIGKARPQKQ